jgi:hypothetical protein
VITSSRNGTITDMLTESPVLNASSTKGHKAGTQGVSLEDVHALADRNMCLQATQSPQQEVLFMRSRHSGASSVNLQPSGTEGCGGRTPGETIEEEVKRLELSMKARAVELRRKYSAGGLTRETYV